MYLFCFNELYFVVRVIGKFIPESCSSFSERNVPALRDLLVKALIGLFTSLPVWVRSAVDIRF